MIRAVLVAAVPTAACTSVGSLTNLEDPPCRNALARDLAEILESQGEKQAVAAALADHTVRALAASDPGPRPFLLASSSGTDYTFFVERKRSSCVLRLYGRQRGFVRYRNNLTYIDSRPLPGCTCRE